MPVLVILTVTLCLEVLLERTCSESLCIEIRGSIIHGEKFVLVNGTMTRASPVVVVNLAPPVVVVNLAPPVGVVDLAPPVVVVNLAPPVVVVNLALPVGVVDLAPPVGVVDLAPPVGVVSCWIFSPMKDSTSYLRTK